MVMSPRRIKWRTYWNFMKIVKRLPTKAERTIIKSVASMAESMFEALINPPEEPKTWAGLPVVVDPTLEPGEWHVGYPETHTIGGVPRR